MEKIIGRKAEQRLLNDWYGSGNAEFVVVYGRRRVGKTFLIRECLDRRITFHHTALSPVETGARGQMKSQLQNFWYSLKNHGAAVRQCPKDWMEAFEALIAFLEELPKRGRMVVFIDELPWMDTPRSGFVPALEHFWNGWGAKRDDLMLIVCGSATSWVSDKILGNSGGLYGRATREMRLSPFTLSECEDYFKSRGIIMDRYSQLQSYMAVGGIPYYLSFYEKGRSLAQNIDNLFFQKGGRLTLEFQRLYSSVFSQPEAYIKVVRVLASRREGFTRAEISEKARIPTGGGLTKILEALEVSDFISSYRYYGRSKRDIYYRLTDFYSLFYLRFVAGNKTTDTNYWENNQLSPSVTAWRGLSFELVCFCHISQLKRAIGISGVHTEVSPWRYEAGKDGRGAQIDMLIDRADNVIDLCEMKFTLSEFAIDKSYDEALREKLQTFISRTSCRKTVHPVLVTTFGLKQNKYSGIIQRVITMDSLYENAPF